MSTDKHSSDPIKESPMGGSLDDGEDPAAQQDAEDEVTSGAASTATAANASSGLGRQPVGPDQGEATLSHSSNRSNDLKGAGLPDSDDTRSLAEALDLLRASVDHLVATKRRTTAAAVSQDMRRRSSNTFTPAAVGFTSFREFLRFAEGVGAVTLLPPVPGGDIEVLSATAGEAFTGPVTSPAVASKPIRRDLWQAFVDWSPQWLRAFDVQTGRAVRLPTGKNGDSAGDVREELEYWREEPDRFRRIIPIARDDQLQWMRTFVSKLPPGEEKDQLHAALENDRPLTAFTDVIRTFPDVGRAWRSVFSDEVTSAITRWIRHEQLTVDIYHMPSTPSGKSVRPARIEGIKSRVATGQADAVQHEAESSDELRQQVLRAVARMPLSELLRLPIPAEYLLLR